MWCRVLVVIVCVGMLAGCGGGGGGGSSSNVNLVGSKQPDLTPNSVLISDLLFSGLGYTNERIRDVTCRPDLSYCEATYRGVTYGIPIDDDDDADGTIYTSLGIWSHMRVGAIFARSEGIEGIYGVVGGIRHPNSLPARGEATWTGEMVALDYNNRLVRGNARLEIGDLRSPSIDVRLEPNGRAAMTWDRIPVLSGRFSRRQASFDYVKGEFYGPQAEEVGGVFERNRMVGSFGALRR